MVFPDYYAIMVLGRTRTAELIFQSNFNSRVARCFHISPWIEVSQKHLFMVGKFLQEPLDAVSILADSKNAKTTKLFQKKLQNTTINLPSCIFRVHTLILLASFFIHFAVVNFCQLNEQGKVNIASMFYSLETDIGQQKSMK